MEYEKPIRNLYNILVKKVPIEAQLIITRRCNLSCGYCTEYDTFSPPIPVEELCRRIDALHRLKVLHITLLGGEPLMHPNIAEIVSHGRRHSTVSITTNGFLLSDGAIEKLNAADLSHMQVSIDAVKADASRFIQKTLKPLRPKLERLKELAKFDVHLNAVLCEQSRDEVKGLLQEVKELGIPITLSIVHDKFGRRAVSGEPYLSLWKFYGENLNHFGLGMIDYEYSKMLLQGEKPSWTCRAGARSLYIDESGNVQFCAPQRGRLNKPLQGYTWEDIRVQSRAPKGCEEGCAVDCVFRASQVDNGRVALLKTLIKAALRNSTNHRMSGSPTHERVSSTSETHTQQSSAPLQKVLPEECSSWRL